MESTNENVGSILHEKQCPFGYQCLTTDCMECAKLYMEKGSEKSVPSHT